VEVWNLVFQQYDRQEDGTLDPLPMRNIDTGMGLERMARVLQGVETNFEIDILRPIVQAAADICGVEPEPGSPQTRHLYRIADHARAIVFCIADGVIPSNEERGYVVRRLLRRAVRDAYILGVDEPFMTRLIDPIIEIHSDPYPELEESRSHLETVIGQEEEAFQQTVRRGSTVLEQHIANLKRQRSTVLRGKEVFDLYQTYGFPLEMTESILQEEGMRVDMQGFLQELEAHQSLSKSASAFEQSVFVSGPLSRLQGRHEPTEFTGYHTLESTARVVAIIQEDELVEHLEPGQSAAVVLDRTPAYGEAGGQVGDRGRILVADEGDAVFKFETVRQEKGFFLHVGTMERGTLAPEQEVLCRVDKERRMATARNHTATHLLHYALREVLGEHARQSGSHVSPERLRFDFSHPTELGEENLGKVEDLVNRKIMEDDPVVSARMSRSEAREAGAIALFGEKYGDIVRVLSIGDYSRELCGGTHCERTGQIGLCRITRESSVAGGVRRIEAVTGFGTLERLREREEQISELSEYGGNPVHRLYYGPAMVDHLIVLSDRWAVQAVDRLKVDPAFVSTVPGAVDCDLYLPVEPPPGKRAEFGLTDEDVVFGVVSRVQWHRRFDVLLDAALILQKRNPRVKIVVCGRGTHRHEILNEPVVEMGLQDTVFPLGYRTDDYEETIATFDAGIMLVPGSDGSCRAAMEMAAMGKPLVVAQRGTLPDIVRDGATGMVVRDTPELLARAILRMAVEPKMRRRMGKAARQRMKSAFSPEGQTQKVIEVYRQLKTGL
jgi:Ser-tRNA(Ala) deacylase AlaX